MNRKDAQHNLDKLKGFNHTDVKAFKHTAKILEYILYELDCLKDREAELPSVFGSYVEDPNYDDYPSAEAEAEVVLPDMVEPELVDLVEDDDEYVDDRNVPLVLAYNASIAPFRMDEVKNDAEGTTEVSSEKDHNEGSEVREEAPRITGSSEVGWDNNTIRNLEIAVVKDKPKKLRIVGEEDKNDLHKEGLKRVKDRLRVTKKKSTKKK